MSTDKLEVWALTRYGPLGASSRMRMLQYLPALARAGCEVRVASLLSDGYLRALYGGKRSLGATLRGYFQRLWSLIKPIPPDIDCIWVEKELWPWAPAWLERWMLARRPWVLDLDDAIFHNYDRHRLALLRSLYGKKVDRLMASARVVTAGSPYLAERARAAGARDVRLVPTTVDLSRYPSTSMAIQAADGAVTIGWIGSPATAHYLEVAMPALSELARRHALRLHVIGAPAPRIPNMECISIPWSEASEVDAIAKLDIGIMPLLDSAWERGKCGYKLIQYMACRLPVVASPVGVNVDLVTPGHNGLLASDTAEWMSSLEQLIADPAQRRTMGQAGRERVERGYSSEVVAAAVLSSLRDAAAPSPVTPHQTKV